MVKKGSCVVCSSQRRLEVDRALIRGERLAGIALDNNWSVQTLRRHRDQHLSKQLVVAAEKQQLAYSTDLLAEVSSLRERVEGVMSRNNNKKGDLTMLKAIKEGRGLLELLLKIELAIHETSSNRSNADDEQAAQEAQEQYAESLQNLTLPELAVWNQLIDKINSGSKQVIIKETGEFDTTKYKMVGFGSEFDDERAVTPTKTTAPRQRMRRKKLSKRTTKGENQREQADVVANSPKKPQYDPIPEDHPLKIREIPVHQIPSSRDGKTPKRLI